MSTDALLSSTPPPVIHVPQPAGRSLLQWEGKHAPSPVAVCAARGVELHGCADSASEPTAPEPTAPEQAAPERAASRLYHGDNRDVLAHLLASGLGGQVRLVYIDPPFASSADYVRKFRLRGPHSRVVGQAVQYRDQWPGDSYLQFMYERLLLLRELLADDGSLWLHCDYRQIHRLHLVLEEVFGADNFLNTIAWRSQVARGAKVNAFYFPFSTQYIAIFARNRRAPTVWHPQKKRLEWSRRQAAAQFMEDAAGFFRTSDPGTYGFERLKELHGEGRLYAPFGGQVVVDEASRRIYASNGGNIGVKYYLADQGNGRYAVERGVDNFWDDIPGLGTTPGEDVGYPTQKTEALLRRVIGAATHPGDLVLDCFAGSGTTLAVAQKMGRRWIGVDASYGAIQAARRRLQRLCTRQAPGFAILQTAGAKAPAPTTDAGVAARVTVHAARSPQDARTAQVAVLDYARTGAAEAGDQRHGSQPPDWRALVDSIEIDPAYDGQVFRPTVVDAPAGRRTLVAGHYAVAIPPSATTLALRITDVFGAEATTGCALNVSTSAG